LRPPERLAAVIVGNCALRYPRDDRRGRPRL